nr:reverse transcriptase domain-containing protein [Tanacetum cinerariifolium]
MPFGLCNASATFQRCMLAIFHDMIKEFVKVFMDDFSIFGSSFDHFLNSIDKMLQSCEDAHLVFNWEKCHFMVKEEIMLGHRVSEACLKVDKAKIDVISKLPPPTHIKDKDLYDSWKSRMELYMQNREHGRMILESVKHGPLIWPTIAKNKATNIILQGLPSNIYSLVNHHRFANDLWERIQLLMQGDDPIACLNKAMNFLTAVASSRGTNASGQERVVKCYNCQGERHMARQCTQPKRPRNATWYKEKEMLAEAQEAGQILNEEQLTFLADSGVPDGQAVQTTIPNNVPHFKTYLNDMENQSMHAMLDFKQTPAVDFSDNEIKSDSNIILYSQYLEETQQENVQDTHLYAQQDSMILSAIEQMSKQMINHVNN